MPLHFEDIHEVSGKLQRQWHPGILVAEIGQLQLFIQAAIAKKAIALDMDDPLRNRMLTQCRQRPVGEMSRKEGVILIDGRTEQ